MTQELWSPDEKYCHKYVGNKNYFHTDFARIAT